MVAMGMRAAFEVRDEPRDEFRYEEAFARNRGLITREEQERLRRATVAIAGCGGVGGSHALALARIGVGGFRLADADRFALVNMNRQAGATVSTIGRNKAAVIREMILEVNPEARVELYEEEIGRSNVDRFLDGADLVIDGIDFFAIEARRLLFAKARERGSWALTAGPLGFGTAFLAFSPDGMSFDRYFDLGPGLSREEQLVAFAVGLAPKGLHLGYLDLSSVDLAGGTGPSSAIGCQLASVVVAAASLGILLGRDAPAPAPAYCQIDPHLGRQVRGRLLFGNRGPLQRLKRRVLAKRLGLPT